MHKPIQALLTEVGNASPGDEAITIAAANQLLALGCDITIGYRTSLESSFARAGIKADHLYLPIDPVGPYHASTHSLLNHVRTSQPVAYERLRHAVAAADIVCVAPGGKYLDGFDNSLKSVTVALAKEIGIPYIILHQSIGPFQNRNEIRLLQEIVNGASLVIAREDISFRYLQKLNPGSHNIILGGDAAMLEDYPQADTHPYALGINLRWSSIGHSTYEGLGELLSQYRSFDQHNSILIYSTTTSLPSEIFDLAQSFSCTCKDEWVRYPDYLMLTGSCRINISDSLHGVIFSIQAKVPVISLQPDLQSWKLRALRGENNELIRLFSGLRSSLDADKILGEICHINASKDYRDKILHRQLSILRRGRQNASLAWSAIGKVLEHMRSRNN